MTEPAPDGFRYVLMKNPSAERSIAEQIAESAQNYLSAALPEARIYRAGDAPAAMTEKPQILVDLPETQAEEGEENLNERRVRGLLVVTIRIRRKSE